MPSNLASPDEIVALSSVLAGYDQGALQHLCRTFALGYDETDRKLLADMVRASGNKPMHANLLLRFTNDPEIWRTCLDVLEGYAREGMRVYPMASANPKGLHLALADTAMLDEMPVFRDVLVAADAEARLAALRDPRDPRRHAPRLRPRAAPVGVRLAAADRRLDRGTPPTPAWTGRTVAELAAERGADPLDTFVDLSLTEDLETVFVIDRPVSTEDRDVIRYLLGHPLTMPGSSDGGAHVNTFCGADYTTRVLTEYVDERVHVRAGRAQALGAAGRHRSGCGTGARSGRATPPTSCSSTASKLAVGPARMLRDFPTGAGRMVWEQRGYVATIVNGADDRR